MLNSYRKTKLDISSWREYKLGDIFDVLTSKYTNPKDYDRGEVPYIARSSENNGVICFVKPLENQELFKGNCITIGAESCVAFYQSRDFLTGNKMYRLYSKNLNNSNALFICNILNKIGESYSYSNAWVSERIKREKIKLPSKFNQETNQYEPDWQYMEDYINSLERELKQ